MLGGRLRDRRLGHADIPLPGLELPDETLDARPGNIGNLNFVWQPIIVPRPRMRRRQSSRKRRSSTALPKLSSQSGIDEPLLGGWRDGGAGPADESTPELQLRAWLAPVSHLDAAEAVGVDR
jgi:hypothetical protein